MSNSLDASAYDRIIVIDTQVVLETQPLDQLPWGELGDGPILLLVCRQVQSEIDAKKNDGRLGTRARKFNHLLDDFLERRLPTNLRESSPRVDVALLSNDRIDWSSLNDLDPDDGDDKIIGQALYARMDDRSRIEILSYDMRPRDAAATHGLKAIKLPEHWLRAPEPSPTERERTRLENELRVLRTDQPAIEITLETITPTPWTRMIVQEASPEQLENIKVAILRKAPRQDDNDTLFSSLNRDYSFDERKRKWQDRLVNDELPNMHSALERLHGQQRVTVIIKNVGSITAEGLSLEIRSGNLVLHTIPYYVLVFGTPAPYPRYFHDPMRHMNLGSLRPQSRHEPFSFYLEEEGPGPAIIWSCSSFRQEKIFRTEISVEITSKTGSKAHIEAVVTARNLKGDERAQIIVPITDQNLRFEEAVDPSTRQLAVPLAYDALDDVETDDDVQWFRNNGMIAEKD